MRSPLLALPAFPASLFDARRILFHIPLKLLKLRKFLCQLYSKEFYFDGFGPYTSVMHILTYMNAS